MKRSESGNASGKIRVLKLQRETLRELNAGELKQAQGGGKHTLFCEPTDTCTRRCPTTKKC